MNKISFVYFDVGGVVVRDFSDSDHWINMKKMLGLDPSDYESFEVLYKQCEDKMCMGADDIQYLPLFSKQFNLTFPQGFSFTKYIVDHFAPNPSIYSSIEYANSICRVGLLTDMYKDMRTYMEEVQLFPDIRWDVVVDSSIEKVKKPMKEIYLLATERAGVPAEEILFIDNREKNLVVPKELGWQTYFYDSRDYEKSSRDLLQFMHAKFLV